MDRSMCFKVVWERRLKYIIYDFVFCTEGRAYFLVCFVLKGVYIFVWFFFLKVVYSWKGSVNLIEVVVRVF